MAEELLGRELERSFALRMWNLNAVCLTQPEKVLARSTVVGFFLVERETELTE